MKKLLFSCLVAGLSGMSLEVVASATTRAAQASQDSDLAHYSAESNPDPESLKGYLSLLKANIKAPYNYYNLYQDYNNIKRILVRRYKITDKLAASIEKRHPMIASYDTSQQGDVVDFEKKMAGLEIGDKRIDEEIKNKFSSLYQECFEKIQKLEQSKKDLPFSANKLAAINQINKNIDRLKEDQLKILTFVNSLFEHVSAIKNKSLQKLNSFNFDIANKPKPISTQTDSANTQLSTQTDSANTQLLAQRRVRFFDENRPAVYRQ